MKKPKFPKRVGVKEPAQRSELGETMRAIDAAAKRLSGPTDFKYGRRKRS